MSIDYVYDVKLPDEYNSEMKYPVIFALHGLGSNEQDMLGLLSELSTDFIVIGIRGHLPQGSGFAYFHIKSIGNPIREHFDQSMQQLEQFIEMATTQYAIDPARRYLLGFSQGAVLSMCLALTMGERIKGIVALNGYIPIFVKDEYWIQSVTDLSVFISHGEHDPIFPKQLGDNNHEFFRQLSHHVTYTTYPSAHGVSLENQQDFIRWIRQDATAQIPGKGDLQ
ncbi:alpha/beta hydrolase [Paenibacillus sp. FSL H7-0331]|uniref:alpha/beta hydrolase n=1 Tax=Paenibacillus sp. FSL H7-0331 TaxID=1920421 RepID=UPI00096F62D9|nr:alpha/beta hydrolase-fold protein [Paenibacillus sp. FSL H7-0331]OMF12313.1 esterase [Paenibacillus sp. FSL H7-0331]